MGTVVMIGVVFANLVADLLYSAVNPRIRYKEALAERDPREKEQRLADRPAIPIQYGVEAYRMKIEIDREEDGRWIAEVPDLPGVMVYGQTREQAISKAEALALRVIADRLDHGESIPELRELFAVPA